MRYVSLMAMLLGLVICGGCASLSGSTKSIGNSISKAGEITRQSIRRTTASNKRDATVVVRDWTLGIPVEAPRGELLAATIPSDAVAHFLPNLASNEIRLVSTHQPLAGFDIRNIAGHAIDDCESLHVALEKVPERAIDVQVDIAPRGASSGRETAMRLDKATLMALSHSTAQQTQSFRVSDEGNPTFVIRDGGVRAHVVLRVERETRLAQIVMTTINCWDEEVLLPVDVRAKCDAQPLTCLTVSDTLEKLYGTTERNLNGSPSFAMTSEREDYLLPVNYKRLSQDQDKTQKTASQGPAFAALSGMRYPGTALLGDARALTGIMLQQERLKRGEQSKTGWLIFSGEAVRTADHIDVSIDLGSGPKEYRFMIPQSA